MGTRLERDPAGAQRGPAPCRWRPVRLLWSGSVGARGFQPALAPGFVLTKYLPVQRGVVTAVCEWAEHGVQARCTGKRSLGYLLDHRRVWMLGREHALLHAQQACHCWPVPG